MSTPPKIKTEPLYRLLREGKVEVFNQEKAQGKSCDLTNCDFRGLDLRAIDADGLDFSGSYFRQADLRGVDLSKAKLQGTLSKRQVRVMCRISTRSVMLSGSGA